MLNGSATDDIIVGLAGADVLNGLGGNDILVGGPGSATGTIADNFNSGGYSGNDGNAANFAGNWTENDNNSATSGDIEIDGNRLRFNETVDGGETIERSMNLAGATAATLSFSYEDDNLGVGQSVIVEARNSGSGTWEVLGTLGSTTATGNGNFSATLTAAQIGANSESASGQPATATTGTTVTISTSIT